VHEPLECMSQNVPWKALPNFFRIGLWLSHKMKTYILTMHEKQLLRNFLQKNELTPSTRRLLSRSASAYEHLLFDIYLVLDGLIKFEKMRKRERT
jgi:hypothetical protein